MFNKIKQAITELTHREAGWLDELIEQIDDPIARRTQWTPTSPGGANFQTQKLIEISPMRMEFHPTIGMKLFAGVFFIIGLGVIVIAATNLTSKQTPLWFMIPFGLVFSGIGAGMYHFAARPKVFDLETLWYWKGRQPLSRAEVEQRKDAATLDQVHAIQILREHCSGSKGGSYYSYEINLVMQDATRVNVVDHGNLSKIRQDAHRLGQFIGVPVWDATGG